MKVKANIVRTVIIAVVICITYMFFNGFFDWYSKHQLYVEQRRLLFDAINAGEEYEVLKKTVSYLQGSATRTLNNFKSTCLYLAAVLVSAAICWRAIKED